jgi:hypothetical protein
LGPSSLESPSADSRFLCEAGFIDDQLTFQQLLTVLFIEIGSASELPFSLYLYLPYNQKILLSYQKIKNSMKSIFKNLRTISSGLFRSAVPKISRAPYGFDG